MMRTLRSIFVLMMLVAAVFVVILVVTRLRACASEYVAKRASDTHGA